jgi:hypothetical protein
MRGRRDAVCRIAQEMAVCSILKSLRTPVHYCNFLEVFLAESLYLANCCVRILQF